jgi:putative phosphoribosyl transferase
MPSRPLEPHRQPRFADRRDAGRQLGRALQAYAHQPGVVVVGLPRGGVPVAFEVAMALHAPLDVVVVRKLGTPGQPELAMGAVAAGGVLVREESVLLRQHIDEAVLADAAERERRELARRERLFRGARGPLQLAGKTVLLVDDGIATGSTVRAAVRAIHACQPHRLVVAVPVAPPDLVTSLRLEADEVVALRQPPNLLAVGLWYDQFTQTDDAEVVALLQQAHRRMAD